MAMKFLVLAFATTPVASLLVVSMAGTRSMVATPRIKMMSTFGMAPTARGGSPWI